MIDGDTITVLDEANRRHRVRLQGIDAPERSQAYSRRSTQNLSKLVYGKRVEVQWVKRDRFERILGKVMVAPPDCAAKTCSMSLDANLAQVESGFAWWFRRYASEQSPEDRALYEAAEKRARAQKRGLWQEPSPVPPWEFRRPTR